MWGQEHQPREPNFLLLPWRGGCGWAAQWLVEGAESLASRQEVSIFNGIRTMTLGPPTRLKRPLPAGEGEHLLCLDTVTPVLIRHDGIGRTTVAASNLLSGLGNSTTLERALGAKADAARLSLEISANATHPARVHTGGTWGGSGTVIGWEGRLILKANGYTRHALEVAALIGIGGRTSLGFGRFRLREVQP